MPRASLWFQLQSPRKWKKTRLTIQKRLRLKASNHRKSSPSGSRKSLHWSSELFDQSPAVNHRPATMSTLNGSNPYVTNVPAQESSSATEECHRVGSDQASSFANQKDSKEELSLIQTEDSLTQCFTAPKMSQISLVEPYKFKSAHAIPNSAADVAAKEEASDECCTRDISTYAESSSIVDTVLEPEASKTTSDQMEYESDDNVPSFSDIEAMILEMDLCPEEFDSFIGREVSRYQDEHSRRTIIRLEQGARSSMQRAIASRGALAVLYGLHMKYYIKEPEVILGRSTMDVDVDIDLGREGRANKISRRQAIIKLEEDGSFSLKNLGKSCIFLNGKEVSSGQLTALGSSSVIEIRDMAFAFEINPNSVKRHLAKITPKNQENKTVFDWSVEPKKVLHG
ncbi:hypothetical protein V6N13_086129 [Hibiscus sabdariffa]|uniref:FHA domain-containing protein n=1 Tax=Hibiscus sabdariffa TaxID=183260 RepID=A0ABR2FS93_9ROSI